MYWRHDEGKSVVAERTIRTLKNRRYKYMTSTPKNVFINKLDDMVNKYSKTCETIKMKSVDVNRSMHADFDKENNNKDPKFKVGNHVRVSKYKSILAKGYISNWSEEVFVIKEAKNTAPWTKVISDLKKNKLLEHFTKKNYKK